MDIDNDWDESETPVKSGFSPEYDPKDTTIANINDPPSPSSPPGQVPVTDTTKGSDETQTEIVVTNTDPETQGQTKTTIDVTSPTESDETKTEDIAISNVEPTELIDSPAPADPVSRSATPPETQRETAASAFPGFGKSFDGESQPQSLK